MSLLKELFSGARQQQQLVENFTDTNNNSPMNPLLIETIGTRTSSSSQSDEGQTGPSTSLEETIAGLTNNLDSLQNNISAVDNIITDNRVGIDSTAKFIRDHKTAVNTAKDVMFNSRRMKETQDEIKRTHLHNIYKNIGIVILLIFSMYLIVYNRKYLKLIIRAIFKLFDQIKEFSQTNIRQMRRDMNTMNNALFSQDLYKKFIRPRRFIFN